MALVLKDRVKETSTTAGTGTITLAGAVAGFQSFAAVGNGNTTYYAIVDPTTGDWEVGIGTYTASGTTLSRTTVLSSSNSGSLVNFVANQKDVFVTYPSEKSVYEDASNVVNATSFGAITATSAALTTGTVSTTPAANTDIANKQYVDGLVTQGISYHEPVYVESPNTAGNLNATYNNGASGVGATLTNAGTQVALTVDGILMTVGKRVLIYNQTNAAENGVYTVTTVGSGSTNWVLTRATDANTYGLRDPNALGYNDAFFVTNGDTGAGETYVCTTTGTITFGTTNITFAQISSAQVYTAGTGLNLSPATTFNISNTGVTATTYGSASAVPVVTFNAQGQATGVTNTTIAIAGSQVSGNITGQAGSVANALTLGTYLTGGTYNGSAAVTATVDATSANTASKVVARDSSGNFSAGTITATLNGTATSTASATNLSGGAANQIAYQSAANTTAFATAPSASNQVLNWNGSAFSWSTGTISGIPLGSNLNSLTAGTYLTGTAYNGSAAQTWTVNAASANTASTVVARDASGNFSASTITASLSGNATTATTATNQSGGTVNATTGAFSGVITSSVASGTVLNMAGQTDSFGYNATAGQGTYIKGTGSTYLYGGGKFYDGSAMQTLLQSGNYNSYAPTLTGTGASGTWNINVTGSAGSSTSSTYTTYISNISLGTGSANVNYGSSAVLRIDGGSGAYLQYAPLLHVAAGDTMWQAQGSYGSSGDGTLYFRQGYNGSWGNWLIMLSNANYNSYAPTLTGTGASGTWGINITGSAGSAPGYLPLSGGTMTGSILSTTNTIVQGTLSGTTYGYLYQSVDGFGLLSNSGSWAVRVNYGTLNTSFFGIAQSNTDMRAPIFYDSDNTGYYVNPNGTSNLSVVQFASGPMLAQSATTGNRNLQLQGAAGTDVGFVGLGSNGAFGFQLYGTGSDYGFLTSAWGSWDLRKTNGGALYLNNQSSYYYNTDTVFMYRVYGAADIRSPIYYDYDNTAYYGNFAGTSNFDRIAVVRSGDNVYTDANYGYGLVGAYSSIRYQGVYAMGDAYKLPPDGTTTGNLYGMAWSHPNAGGAASNLNTHGLLLLQNGGFMAALSTNGTFSADVRGTIFYDYNNTGYYVDPASSSNMYEVYANNWFRTYGVTGLYSQSYASHFYPQSNGRYWSITGNGSTDYGGLLFKINYESTIKGYVYWDTSGFGLLHGNGGWSVRGNLGAVGGQFYGSWFSDTDLRAPIFYDYNNTGYYLNPDSTSNLYSVQSYYYYRTAGGYGYLNGSYPSVETGATSGPIYSIGGSYVPGTTSLGNMYGVGYTVGNISGISIVGNWGFYVASAGVARHFLDSDSGVGYASGSYRAPIFYDYDNTAYYGDFAGTSRMNSVLADVLYSYGNVTAYHSSDIKFKTNVRDIPNALEIAESIGGKLFDWTDEYIEEHGGEDDYFMRKADFGVIAQDVLKVFPVAVRTRPDGSLAVDYEKLSAIAFAAVASLSTRVKSLEARI